MKQQNTPSGSRRLPRTASVAVTVIMVCLLIANMAVIFLFSSADRVESGETSAGVTRFLLETFHPHYGELPEAGQAALIQRAHRFVRKAAHFCEFALLGFLSAGLFLWLSARTSAVKGWMTLSIPAVFTLLYAASDEIHQMFTNRGPRVTDVLIDFGGALCGICVAHLLFGLIFRKKDKRKKALCETRDTN